VSGCAAVSSRQIQGELSQSVGQRIHQPLDWNLGAPEDRIVHQIIDQMLADELTAGEAIAIALVNNRDLRAILAQAAVARADLVSAGLLDNPVFGVSVLGGGDGTEIEYSLFEDFLSIFTISARRKLAAGVLERPPRSPKGIRPGR
jgi:hypothetical protein